MRLLLSAGVSSFDADASDSGVDERLLLGKLAKLFSGTRVVIDAGGVSSLLPGSDLTGVLEKCSRLDRTSVCCKQEAMTLSLSLSLSLSLTIDSITSITSIIDPARLPDRPDIYLLGMYRLSK